MDHWAKAVIETVDSIPKTPPPSPVVPPKATTKSVANCHNLDPDHARTVDLELAQLDATSPQQGVDCKKDHSVKIKPMILPTYESPTTEKPAIWRLCAALLAGAFQQSLSTGLIMTYGTILSYYTTNLLRSTSSTQLNLIGAVPAFFLLSLALPFGRLLDVGFYKRLNIIAGLLISASLFSLAFTTHHHDGEASGKYYAVLLCAMPLGVGQSIYFLSSTHIARTWLSRRTGLALGAVNTGAALGGSLFPLVFTHLTTHHTFPVAILSLAGIATCLSIFIAFFAVPNPPTGRPPPTNQSPTPSPAAPRLSVTSLLPRSFFKPNILLFTLATSALYAGVLSIPFYLPAWSLLLPLHSPPRVSLVTVMNLSQLPGRVLASVLADCVGARWLNVAILVGAAVVVPGFWCGLVTGDREGVEMGMGSGKEEKRVLAAAYAFAIVYGVCHGGMVALIANGVVELLKGQEGGLRGIEGGIGSGDEDGVPTGRGQLAETEGDGAGSANYGHLSGWIYTVAAPLVLAGPLINGVLADSIGIKAVGVWGAGCFGLAACLMSVSLAFEQPQTKRRAFWAVADRRQQKVSLPTRGEDEPSLGEEEATKGESWEMGRWRVASPSCER